MAGLSLLLLLFSPPGNLELHFMSSTCRLSEEKHGIYYVKYQGPHFSLQMGMSACWTHSLSFSLRSLSFSSAPFQCDSCPHPQINSEPLNAINFWTKNALCFMSLKNSGLLLGHNFRIFQKSLDTMHFSLAPFSTIINYMSCLLSDLPNWSICSMWSGTLPVLFTLCLQGKAWSFNTCLLDDE